MLRPDAFKPLQTPEARQASRSQPRGSDQSRQQILRQRAFKLCVQQSLRNAHEMYVRPCLRGQRACQKAFEEISHVFHVYPSRDAQTRLRLLRFGGASQVLYQPPEQNRKIDNKKYRPNSGRYFVFVFLSVFSLVFEIVRQKSCAALLQKTALYNRPVVEPHVPRQIVKRAAAARLWV